MKKLILLLTLGLWAALPTWAADTVELLPGKITGSITLSSETVRNGTVYANATDGSSSANASFTGSTYSIVVPAGKSWKLTFYIYPEVPSGGYSYVYLNLPEVLGPVGGDETLVHDFPVATSRIVADVQVANGALTGIPLLQASGNSGGSNQTYFSYYGQNLSYAVALPMSGVSVQGSATVTNTDNQSSAQSLAAQTVDVSAGGVTATWNLDAAFSAGAIQGDVALVGSNPMTSATLYLYSPSGTNVGSASLSTRGAYQFLNLLPGDYRIYNYAGFTNAQLYMYGTFPAVAGEITQNDYNYQTSQAFIGVNLTGFLTTAQVSSGYAYGYWTAPNPNPNSLSNTAYAYYSPSAGGFTGVVIPGEWKFSQMRLSSYDYSQPGVYLSYSLGIYDYQRAAAGVTFADGVDQTLPSFDLETTQTELTFDVVEAPGSTSETLISSARVNGYVTTYENGSPKYQLSFDSNASTSAAQPRQRVRIVGIPGTYNLQTYGTVDGSNVSFGSFTLELKTPLPTPVGTNVVVEAGGGVELVFDEVTTGGVSTASQLPVGPALPGGYTAVVNHGQKAYYSISTTATFSGNVDVTVDYAADAVDAELEGDLRLFYFDDASQTWIDVTVVIDTANNQITGTAPKLALFAIGVPHAPVLGAIEVPGEVLDDVEFTVTASFIDVDPGEVHSAVFTWGDGSTSDGTVNELTGEISVVHTFTQGGSYDATLTLTDITDNRVSESFTIVVTGSDAIAPVIAVEAIIDAEATGPDGAVVDFDASALDETDGTVPVETSVASGSVFPLGSTTVTATSTDVAGNVATVQFVVNVVDTTAPEIAVPSDLVIEATSANGAAAAFDATSADIVSGSPAVVADIDSGSTFALGTSVVTLVATDAAGNIGTAQFNVTVQDTTAPVIDAPADLVIEATGPAGAAATFDVSADDIVSGSVAVTSSAESGSTFAVGTTTVTFSATDAAGNAGTASFSVTVQDTTAPVLSVPGNLVIEATSPAGAEVTFAATAADIVSSDLVVSTSVASGSTFPMGTTTVEVSTTDEAGNTTSGSFTVTVQDTTAPVFTSLTPSIASLWPPNHKMVAITVTADVSDVVGVVTTRIVSVTSNEPDYTRDDDDRRSDIAITGDMTVDLRAERLGKGDGRIYTITVEATDAAGNVAQFTTTVTVPKDQKEKSSKSSKSSKADKDDGKGKSSKDDKKQDSKNADRKSVKAVTKQRKG